MKPTSDPRWALAGTRWSGLRRRMARVGARPALMQALAIVLAFVVAGALTTTLSGRLQTAAAKEHVMGEVRSMEDEFAIRGAIHLPHTVAKRTRLWRGFGYRLTSAQGVLLAGALRAPPQLAGWSRLDGVSDAPDHGRRPFLVFTERLPDGSRLSVGQDRSAEVLESAATLRALALSGVLGVGVGVAASCAVSRRAWRRVAAVADAAALVREGHLDPRAPAPDGAPRDDLDVLALTFNAMLDRIGILVGQVRQVSRDIAHDLRTPLTRVRHRLERLRADASASPELAARIEAVEADIAEILRTFDALLQLADIEAEHGGDMCAFDLGEVVSRVGEAFRPDVEEGGRSLAIAPVRVLVTGQERLVGQAVANLIENAARHTPIGSHIALAVEAGPAPRLVVQDDGPGIAADDRQAALRPMVRLEASRHLPGAGLGLSIVAAVAARHRASLELADAAPGLRATLTFP